MNNSIKVVFPDGSSKNYPSQTTFFQVAEGISKGLASNSLGAAEGERLFDINTPLSEAEKEEINVVFVKKDDPQAEKFYRHTLAHIMAQAVTRLYKDKTVNLGIGPAIENGFYYDIDLGEDQIKEEDIPAIEKEMKKIIEENLPLERFELPRSEAVSFMEEKGQHYKVELIKDLPEGEKISFYRQGEFVDLCRGPHLPRTGMIKNFKILSLAGAYWRGSEKNPMLQRLYGTAFESKEKLTDYLNFLEEAKRRDHRRLGPQLDLILLNTDVAAGMPFFLPNGVISLNELTNMWRKFHKDAGYQEVITPLVMHEKLWHQSGHWDHYRENMYFIEKDGQNYAVKPMNCPGHIIIYKKDSVSYRDLPWKMAEFGKVHRYERSGVLHGLFRVRAFTQDDAHIFCTEDQVRKELVDLINLIDRMYKVFGFEYLVELSTKPENAMGSDKQWEDATEALRDALEETGVNYKINEGDGAFYGPKIDFHVKDSIGRTWQCATVQLDFQMPERFELKYIGQDNNEHRPVMIHRTVFGSLERFFGILIEHFAGAFPTWLAPVQVILLPIADRHVDYSKKVQETLEKAGIRVSVDDRQKKTNYKIREAQMMKIPYMMIIGDREEESGTVSLRLRSERDYGVISVDEFVPEILEETTSLSLESVFEKGK